MLEPLGKSLRILLAAGGISPLRGGSRVAAIAGNAFASPVYLFIMARLGMNCLIGFIVPILVDEGGLVLAGHGRHAAAKLLGLNEVPVIKVTGLSTAKRRALAIADNAGWDRQLLASELPKLAELLIVEGLDVSLTGFAPVEIDQLAIDFEHDASDPADGVDPEWSTAPTVSKPGDLWKLGDHLLLCGDARNADHLSQLMGKGARMGVIAQTSGLIRARPASTRTAEKGLSIIRR